MGARVDDVVARLAIERRRAMVDQRRRRERRAATSAWNWACRTCCRPRRSCCPASSSPKPWPGSAASNPDAPRGPVEDHDDELASMGTPTGDRRPPVHDGLRSRSRRGAADYPAAAVSRGDDGRPVAAVRAVARGRRTWPASTSSTPSTSTRSRRVVDALPRLPLDRRARRRTGRRRRQVLRVDAAACRSSRCRRR